MAKTPVSFTFHDDLRDWIRQYQKKTGVSGSRLMSAALMQFFFNRGFGPDHLWIQLATAIDLGDMPFFASILPAVERSLLEEEKLVENLSKNPEFGDMTRLEFAKSNVKMFTEYRDKWIKDLEGRDNPHQFVRDVFLDRALDGIGSNERRLI